MINETSEKASDNNNGILESTLNTHRKTRIGTWNVRTLRQKTKLAQLEKEMETYSIKLLGLSEMRWPQTGESKTSNGNTIIHSGQTNDTGQKGVGILFHKTIKHSLINWKPVSDRIIYARIQTKIKKVSVLQCYAPTEMANNDDKDQFYEELTTTLLQCPRTDIIILMGDFNAKCGSNKSDSTGSHGLHNEINDNGHRLRSICSEFRLVIGGTLFPHKNIHKYTWTQPGNRAKNQIDHICISHRWKSSLLDVRTKRQADIESDHMLLIGEIRLKPMARKQQNNQSRLRKLNIQRLQVPTVRQEYLHQIHITETEPNQQTIRQIAEKTVGVINNHRKPWISNATWSIIEQRKEVRQSMLQDPNNTPLKIQHQAICKQIKKCARKDKRSYYNNIAKEAQLAAETNDMRMLYSKIKQLNNRGIRRSLPLRDANGNLLTTTEQQMERWTEFFSEQVPQSNIHRDVVTQSGDLRQQQSASRRINTNPPTIREIQEAIVKLKNNKAEGIDGIPAELMKTDPELFANALQPTINQIWTEEKIPNSWKQGLIIKLPKKGDLTECENWRGITILNCAMKILASIIHSRIVDLIETQLRDEQAGFRRGRGCIDNSNTLRQIVEQSVEWNSKLYIAFIDFKRAFDTISRPAIWNALRAKGIPDKIVKLIIAMYDGAETHVLHNGQLSATISTTTGVKQGCPLSPLLFITVLDDVMRKTCRQPRGIRWGIINRLESLEYADDLALLTHNARDMREKLNDLITYAGEVGLQINARKTKIMGVNVDDADFYIGENIIERVQSFSYLGSIISTDGGAAADINNRINLARAAFASMRPVWSSSQLSRDLKLRIFNACVKSILLYGSETWLTRKADSQRIQVFVNKCLRIICRIFYPLRIRNEDLWELTSQEPMDQQIMRRKWRFIGHTLRRSSSITKQALDWSPQGRRGIGRPRQTWRRSLQQDLQTQDRSWGEIKSIAENRVRWRAFTDALCSRLE